MRGLFLSVFAFMQVSQEAPQGSLNDLQSGFNRVVTTGEDENAPYTVIQKYDLTVFARSVSGYPDFGEEAEKLKNMLQIELANQVDFSSYIVMNFNSPRKIINRRTDIMYKKF